VGVNAEDMGKTLLPQFSAKPAELGSMLSLGVVDVLGTGGGAQDGAQQEKSRRQELARAPPTLAGVLLRNSPRDLQEGLRPDIGEHWPDDSPPKLSRVKAPVVKQVVKTVTMALQHGKGSSSKALPRPPPPLRSDVVTTPKNRKLPVVFYGICDLKYDRERRQVRILEFGSGQSSRFSGYGRHLPEEFEERYRLANEIDCAALVNNKKMTHDVFVECGLAHLRPLQRSYPRHYTPQLAARIAKELELTSNSEEPHIVVLKLVNRCRGAGVVLTQPGEDLDKTLRFLLEPQQEDVKSNEISIEDATALDPHPLQEAAVHWWSNECPVFVAERCEASSGVPCDGHDYDATMRIGFVLARNERNDSILEAQFLGGYWKLPLEPKTSSNIWARCISKAHLGTAPVEPADLSSCYAQLSSAIPQVFALKNFGMQSLMHRYSLEPLMFAFVLARQAAEKVKRAGRLAAVSEIHSQRGRAITLLDWAQTKLEREFSFTPWMQQVMKPMESGSLMRQLEASYEELVKQDLISWPLRLAHSSIQRQMGVIDVHCSNDWESAMHHWNIALILHPMNATAEYFKGLSHLRFQQYAQAKSHFIRTLRLDPELKAAYVNLGVVEIALGEWDGAIAVSEAGLRRHPEAFQCSYHLGVALGHALLHILSSLGGQDGAGDKAEAAAMARRSASELRDGKEQKEQLKSLWSTRDEELLVLLETAGVLLEDDATPSYGLPCLRSKLHGVLADMKGWPLYYWRP